jgi:hypothetical protein
MYCALPVFLRRFFAILVKTTDFRVSLMNKMRATSTIPAALEEQGGQKSEELDRPDIHGMEPLNPAPSKVNICLYPAACNGAKCGPTNGR